MDNENSNGCSLASVINSPPVMLTGFTRQVRLTACEFGKCLLLRFLRVGRATEDTGGIHRSSCDISERKNSSYESGRQGTAQNSSGERADCYGLCYPLGGCHAQPTSEGQTASTPTLTASLRNPGYPAIGRSWENRRISLKYCTIQYFTRQRATPGNVPLALAAIRGTFHVYNNII